MRINSAATSLGFLATATFVAASKLPGLAGATPADIVSPGSGLTLGSGWYSREVFQGRPFRWVNNDVAIVIHRPQTNIKKISIELQGGPGLADPQKFQLHIRSSANTDIASVVIPGSKTQRFDLPVSAGHDSIVKLHVDGGGKKIPKDPRTLNFRVFSISDASSDKSLGAGHPDITRSGVRLDNNWYSLEEFGGETFRWVNNDAEFTVPPSPGGKKLEVYAASGPAVRNPSNWALTLQDQSGKSLGTTHVKARGKATFDLPVGAANATYKLHVTSTNAKSPNDARTLSFRVFSISTI